MDTLYFCLHMNKEDSHSPFYNALNPTVFGFFFQSILPLVCPQKACLCHFSYRVDSLSCFPIFNHRVKLAGFLLLFLSSILWLSVPIKHVLCHFSWCRLTEPLSSSLALDILVKERSKLHFLPLYYFDFFSYGPKEILFALFAPNLCLITLLVSELHGIYTSACKLTIYK